MAIRVVADPRSTFVMTYGILVYFYYGFQKDMFWDSFLRARDRRLDRRAGR